MLGSGYRETFLCYLAVVLLTRGGLVCIHGQVFTCDMDVYRSELVDLSL